MMKRYHQASVCGLLSPVRSCMGHSSLTFLMITLVAMFATLSCAQFEATAGKDDLIQIRDFGAVGGGVTDNTAVLQNMFERIGDDGARVVIPTGQYLVGDITFPEQVTLIFRSGGRLVVQEDAVLHINGTIEANIEQIFEGDGVVTGSPKNLQVYPQWFGARGDGVHNDAPAIQKAAELAAGSLGNTVFIPSGEYLFLEDLQFRSNIESQGLLIKEMEIDEDRTSFSNFTFVHSHFAKNNPHIYFVADHEEKELDASAFYGVQEGQFRLPAYQGVPLANGNGQIDLMEGGLIRLYSSDFFSSRNNQKGDQYYDRNDVSQLVSGRGDIFPELAFSYEEPPRAAQWSASASYEKGDYVSWRGEIFKATWPSGPGSIFEDRYLGSVDVGPVQPGEGEQTTRYDFVFEDGSEDALTMWRRVEMSAWYREKDRPLTVNGLRVEVRLVNPDGEAKRVSGGAVIVRRSNMTFNHVELTVRDPDLTLGQLLNSSGVVNNEYNNGYFSGATYHGLGYNILNSNVANIRYYNTVSVNSRKGLDGRHGKNITIQGGHFNVIDDHYGRNYIVRDVVLSGRSTWIPGYVTPDADLQAWHFQTVRAFGFAGANLHVENVTINQFEGRIPEHRTEMEQLYGAIGGVLSVRSDIGDLYGTIVLRNIRILGNDGDVRVFNHTIEPTFNFVGPVGVPSQMIIEDVHLENPGEIRMEIGRGFDPGTYGPVEIRNTGPLGDIYSSSRTLRFTNCTFRDAEFDIASESWIYINGCTFHGNNTGLQRANIGANRDNLLVRDAEVDFPLEFVNPARYRN